MFVFFLIQVRNKVIVFLLNSVLCFNNCSVASVPPRTSIVYRLQRLRRPQKGCPNPSGTLLTTTTQPARGGTKQTHWKGVGHICIFYRTQQGVHLWMVVWAYASDCVETTPACLPTQRVVPVNNSTPTRLVPYARQSNGGNWGNKQQM